MGLTSVDDYDLIDVRTHAVSIVKGRIQMDHLTELQAYEFAESHV